jgi:4-amino-4-deoxychorismate lyase
MTGALPSVTRRPDQSRTPWHVNTLWLVNGHSTGVDPADRGLAYGDGVFETMAADAGVIRWFDLHLDRLEEGCRRLEIPAPSRSLLAYEVGACCPKKGRAVVKLIVTRGPGTRGYLPPEPAAPTRVLSISSWPDYPVSHYHLGISARVCQLRLGENPALAGIKHLCRLEQVLAQLELRGHAVQQGLLLDTSGRVVGGTSSNLFVVQDGELTTPALTRCGIKGVMRRAVLETARTLGLRAAERDLTLADVLRADEVFVTNALFGIWPVTDIDGQKFVFGPRTRQLMSELKYPDAS